MEFKKHLLVECAQHLIKLIKSHALQQSGVTEINALLYIIPIFIWFPLTPNYFSLHSSLSLKFLVDALLNIQFYVETKKN